MTLLNIENILGCVRYIEELQIRSGESFIYSQLKELIEFLASKDKIRHITIAINGTVIPKNDLVDVIKEHNVCIRISNYPITRQIGMKLSKLFDDDVNYTIYNFAFGVAEWAYMGGIDTAVKMMVLLSPKDFGIVHSEAV